ncbi:hypothetical protein FEM08_22440 [Flavobacterium gilvum]|nr:hypothetical protein FEM08_22440 [Flavobacterium gilvum]
MEIILVFEKASMTTFDLQNLKTQMITDAVNFKMGNMK